MSETPDGEAKRLESLRRYQILDTQPEPQFDDIAEVARALFAAPIALISLVDEHRQWFKASVGLAVRETPRGQAFCEQTIRGTDALVIKDARQDDRFRDIPLVAGEPQIRFYAGAPLRTPDGFNLGALCVMDSRARDDVTARQVEMLTRLARVVVCEFEARQRAEITRQAEQRYRRIVETANEGIWVLDAAARTTCVNARMAEMLGYRVEEVLGRPNVDFMDPAARQQHEQDWAACKSGASSRHEFRLRRRDGTELWTIVSAVPIHDADGNFAGALAMFIDITDRKRAAEVLEESETRLRQAGRMAKFGHWLWVADVPGGWADGRSEYSAEGAAILGRDPADLTMGTVEYCERIVHPDDGERVRLFCERMNDRAEGAYTVEYRIVRPDGEIRDVLEFAENTYDAAGRIVSTIGTIQDVTERKRMEEQRLKQVHLTRVGILGELSGVLAHELNQPLAAILSNAQAARRLLERETPDLEQTRDALDDIVEADKRADDVIERLAALLRRGETQFRPLDLNTVVNEALGIADGDLVLHGVTTACRLTQNLPAVRGDAIQLQRVLLNLIANACEAMSDTEPRQRALTITSALGDNQTVLIGVSDQGGSIAPNVLEKLFQPFVTTKTHGLGLGLPICRSIISAHGGHIWAINNPDHGATFRFALPIHSEERT